VRTSEHQPSKLATESLARKKLRLFVWRIVLALKEGLEARKKRRL